MAGTASSAGEDGMIRFDARLDRPGFQLKAAFETGPGVTALFGPSGSGKSTIIRLIAGLERPGSGEIAIDGTILSDSARFTPPHRRRIGLVFQDAQLFPHLSVRRNIRYGRFFTLKAERRISEEAVIETMAIGPLLDRRPITLSGGERQRVAMARAILSSPRLLAMDEPLASLDQGLKRTILPFIEKLRDEFGIPILYVSHAVEEVVRLASHVIRIENGHVAAAGQAREVLASMIDPAAAPGPGPLSVLTASGARYDAAYDVSLLDHPAGRITVPGRLPDGPLRIAIPAAQVALLRGEPGKSTVRTMLHGKIERIEARQDAYAIVHLLLEGGDSLIALVTRLAVADLDLKPGDRVLAMVKSVSIDRDSAGRFSA
jgi:molybdate transport system ATP-binding protein